MDFSIILCAYNPEPSRLERVLSALRMQNYTGTSEIIVVDNNSTHPLSDLKFIRGAKDMTCLTEKKQGLAWARIKGFLQSSGETIVFVDDDNVLAPDYLTQLKKIQEQYPQVGACGPGIITLEYESSPPEWIRKHFGYLFQEKSRSFSRFGKETGWPDYYPAGSGMCVKRKVLEIYAQKFNSGEFTASGRQGNTLSSGEDSQIVWTGVKMGLEAGTAPDLRLIHLIPASRLSLAYLTNLQFHLGRSYCQAMSELFPEKIPTLKSLSIAGQLRLLFRVLMQSKFQPLLFYRKCRLELAWFRGVKKWTK